MSLLFSVITAAYASGTHHRLALDGVRRLDGADAAGWQRLFLKHADVLVKGSKAPDDEFKDFKNHVLHPRDDFWGGAPEKARAWYTDLVETLAKGDWPAAVWAAGVLSHYVTDPIAPFHTQQSEAENAIHRAFEWSVSRSYDALKAIAAADAARTINVADDANWLEQLLADAATEANQHYEKLIAHYDINRGVVDPPSGLDVVAQRIVGDMLGLAAAVFGTVLQRAITESRASPPEVSLALDVVLATLRIPLKKLLAKLADRQERAQVEAMYDELKATGTVEVHLPEDDRVVRDAYAAEVLAKRPAADKSTRFPAKVQRPAETDGEARERLKRIGRRDVATAGDAHGRAMPADRTARELPVSEPPRPAPKAGDQLKPAQPVGRFRGEALPATATSPSAPAHEPSGDAVTIPLSLPPAETSPAAPHAVAAGNPLPVATAASLRERLAVATAMPDVPRSGEQDHAPVAQRSRRPTRSEMDAPRLYLTSANDVVDAPSIGPRMAERLLPLGIATVAELLAAEPGKVAARLAMSSVDADVVKDWQDQARLVCTVPGLRGTHAQLLVGAGYRSASSLADASPDDLCARVLAYAAGTEGRRLLRNADPPDVERIKAWLDAAREARAA